MPNLSASKKSMRQSLKARERNYNTRAELKKTIKDVLRLAKAGSKAEVVKMLPKVYSVIDTAAKKRILHRNNAAHKKSRLAALAAS